MSPCLESGDGVRTCVPDWLLYSRSPVKREANVIDINDADFERNTSFNGSRRPDAAPEPSRRRWLDELPEISALGERARP
jgi:hypothetical protein